MGTSIGEPPWFVNGAPSLSSPFFNFSNPDSEESGPSLQTRFPVNRQARTFPALHHSCQIISNFILTKQKLSLIRN
jgi:hypothetical protein